MAENKKSFILYCDLIHTVEQLSNEYAGILFKHTLRYVNDKNPELENLLINIAFEPIKQQLKRDLRKWENTSETRSEVGRKGGIASGIKRKEQKEANEAIALMTKQKEAKASKRTDNVTVNVNDNVNDIIKELGHEKLNNEKFISSYIEWLDYRKESKWKALTSRGVKLQLKMLNEQDKPIEVLNQSIMNGYKGLFELKTNGNRKQKVEYQGMDDSTDFEDLRKNSEYKYE